MKNEKNEKNKKNKKNEKNENYRLINKNVEKQTYLDEYYSKEFLNKLFS
jgi:hypothetical protein